MDSSPLSAAGYSRDGGDFRADRHGRGVVAAADVNRADLAGCRVVVRLYLVIQDRSRRIQQGSGLQGLSVRLRVEEYPADDSVGPAGARERDHDVPTDLPLQVGALGERGGRLGVQNGSGGGICDLDLIASKRGIEVEQVEAEVVRLAVSDVDIDRKARGGVPACGDAVGAADGLESAGDRRRSCST